MGIDAFAFEGRTAIGRADLWRDAHMQPRRLLSGSVFICVYLWLHFFISSSVKSAANQNSPTSSFPFRDRRAEKVWSAMFSEQKRTEASTIRKFAPPA